MQNNVRRKEYDLERLTPRENNVIRMPREKKDNRRFDALEGYLKAFGLIVVATVMLSLIGYKVYGNVQLTELNDQIGKVRTEKSAADSENVRLQTEFDALLATRNIEEQAKLLGMQRMKPDQLEYIFIEGGDRIKIMKEKEPDNWLSALGEDFFQMFS